MKNGVARKIQQGLLALMLLLSAVAASAQGFMEKERGVIFAPYLWGTGISGTSTVGALPPVDVDADFGDLLDNLNFALSLHTEFKYDNWVFVIDPTYLSLEMDAGLPEAVPLEGNPTVEVDIWMVELWAGYKFVPNWEVIGGARYQSQDISLIGLPNPPFPPDAGVDEDWTDWFIGLRTAYDLGEKWFFNWRIDVAIAGDSESSWNTALFFNRRFGKSMALNLGYRYFEDEFIEEGVYGWDVTQDGPIIGYTWTF